MAPRTRRVERPVDDSVRAASGYRRGHAELRHRGVRASEKRVRGMLDRLEGRPSPGCVVHSDRGWHYRTPDWVSACEAMGVTRSMSRLGRSPDNAACEAFSDRLKVEFFHGGDWSGWTPGRFAAALGGFVGGYNSGRLKSFGGRYETIDGRRARLGLTA